MVSELVTNSVLHGGASDQDEIELSLAWNPDRIRVEVLDYGPGFGASLADPDRSGGWGLQLVEKMADRWGVTRTGATVVWFEMLLAEAPPTLPEPRAQAGALAQAGRCR